MEDATKQVLAVECQKCDVRFKPVRLSKLDGPIPGTYLFPDMLYCKKCMALLTIHYRDATSEELKVWEVEDKLISKPVKPEYWVKPNEPSSDAEEKSKKN